MLETHKRMEGYAELIERKNDLLRAIKALQFEEANRCVSERDVERYPDGQSYGESQLESMKQTQHMLMHLSDQTHRLRRREFNVEEARVALKLVHSEECAEQILTYIIEAENLSTRIFQADTEADRVGLSQSKTMAEKKPEVTSANSGAAMHPQDLSSEPVNLSEEQGSDTIARAMRMIASSLQMLQQEKGKPQVEPASDRARQSKHSDTLFLKMTKAGVIAGVMQYNVDELKHGKQREPFIIWINGVLRNTCNTVSGFDRPWAYLTKLLEFTLVAPGKQNNSGSTGVSAMGSMVNAINRGQSVDPREKAEDMRHMILAHCVSQDEVHSEVGMTSTAQMSEEECTYDQELFPVIMQCIREGQFKTQYSEATLLDPELKTASFLIFTIMYRMSRTILEQLAVSKILAVQWQDMPCSTSTDSIDMFQKMRRGETIRKQYENLMSYLEVALKLQNRGQTHADKLALQRFVTFFETGVGTGELEPAMVYFQMVQDMYISETQTHSIDNGGPTTTAELEKLNRDNRDLKRQIQTLEAKAQSMNNGSGNSIKAAAVMENAFESYNKQCSRCKEYILVNAPFKEKHKMCNTCFRLTPEGKAKQAEYLARQNKHQGVFRKSISPGVSKSNPNHVKINTANIDAANIDGGAAEGGKCFTPPNTGGSVFVSETEMLRMRKAQTDVAKAANGDTAGKTVRFMMLKVVEDQSVQQVEDQSMQQETVAADVNADSAAGDSTTGADAADAADAALELFERRLDSTAGAIAFANAVAIAKASGAVADWDKLVWTPKVPQADAGADGALTLNSKAFWGSSVWNPDAHKESVHLTALNRAAMSGTAVDDRAKKHQRDGTAKPHAPVELRVVEWDDSNDDGATSQHAQTHQHLKSVTEEVVAPIVATGYTDPNVSDMQRIECHPDQDFQVYQGVRYWLATTQQADAVQPNPDKKGKKSVNGMEPPACDPGLNGLYIQNEKMQLQSTLLLQRTSNAQENTFGVATSSKSEPTNSDTAANSSKSAVGEVHAPILSTCADAIADVDAATNVGAAAYVNNAQYDSIPRISFLKAGSGNKTQLLNASGTGHSIPNDSGAAPGGQQSADRESESGQLKQESIYSQCGPMCTITTTKDGSIAFNQANRFNAPVPQNDSSTIMKVVLKTPSVQGDLETVPFIHVGCQCAPTGREGREVQPEKRPVGRHRGDVRAQFKRNQQRHHKAGDSTIKYGFHRKQREANAARQHDHDDHAARQHYIQRIQDGHLTDMEVHEWWLNRPLSNDQVCVQADAIESAPQDFVESQEFVEMLEKTMPEGCNALPQTLTDGERYLEVPIPQEFVEVFEKPDDSQEKTNTIEQIQHELDRMNDANILFQHHSRTWWDEPPVDYRTEEEWLEELEQGRSETPNRDDFYPGAGFEPKCGIVNKMIGDVVTYWSI